MKVIFLDIDGVMNSTQEVIYHLLMERRKNSVWYRNNWLDKFIYARLFDGFQLLYKATSFRTILWKLYYLSNHCDWCPIACANLQWLLNENPDIRIVVSSTWRLSWGVKWLKKIFYRNHMDGSRIIGITPKYARNADGSHEVMNPVRGHQIQAWLIENGQDVTHYVIIDDDSDMAHLSDKLVQTHSDEGLTWKKLEAVAKKLEAKT